MKIEDLKVGMILKREHYGKPITITAIGDNHVLARTESVRGIYREVTLEFETLRSYEIFRKKKRYWLWKVKYAPQGYILKFDRFIDENGIMTNGEAVSSYLNIELIEKCENDWIEI